MFRVPKAGLVFAVAAMALAWSAVVRAEFRIQSVDNDFQSEIEEAASQNKRLVIMFHESGCPYCAKMRARVFPDPAVDAFYSSNFVMIEVNKNGSLPVVTPDGKEMTEKSFANKNRVRLTPVFLYYDKDGKFAGRIIGYFDKDLFNKAGKYVVDEVHKTGTDIYSYMRNSK